ncbi:ecto-NOX disulfide-thiol exchanger 2 isoform X3 [Microcaecilia unicolor]|uniref:Ecto-NOX disulfide-thiol exchanger 2 isoform X3 n=1 Tax=Microcaecilia unicolor TaxID=1415580 RepID=A0A6P7YQ82_9AMPH|nr:ecto-NOX disulfide-thiol exchanger 2 isoform X3 [Microcaecilia unicolor]
MYTRQRLSRDAGGLNQLTFGAANNSELLHFNTTNCSLISEGPFENGSEINKKRKRTNIVQESIGNLGMDSTPLTLSVSDPNSWTTALNNLGMTSMGMSGQPLLSDFDSGVGLMPGIPAISPLMPGMDVFPPPVLPDVPVVKEIIHCKSCTLFPPNPNLPPPARRERPPGCKTVFVGGLPENATDEIILEIFEQCGELVAIRKSKKNFCHIRFTDELAIDKAVYLSDDSKFREAIQTLLAWIERGEVNRRTANHFYSMIQSANSHIRRLVNEKAAHEKAMEVAKESYMVSLSGILLQFEQIVAVYHSACKQKAWDNFSKAQRKNISIWCKQAEEIRNIHSQELMGVRREEEMEMSDDELENPAEAKETEESALQAQADALKEENDSLRWQLDAYRNEVELLKQEQGNVNRSDEDVTRDEQLKILKQALQGMQQHLLKLHTECKKKEAELAKLREEKLQSEKLLDSLNNQQETTDNDDKEGDPNKNQENETTVPIQCVSNQDEEERLPETSLRTISSPVKSEREALLIGIISTFLHVHPFGASIEYICSYLQRLDSKICTNEVEMILSRRQHTFKQEMSGVGASLEKRWKFCGFEGLKMT